MPEKHELSRYPFSSGDARSVGRHFKRELV
jgi:hypothetical protein